MKIKKSIKNNLFLYNLLINFRDKLRIIYNQKRRSRFFWNLRDGDNKRFLGKGVLKAVENINKIISVDLKGQDVSDQENIDNLLIKLDGTKNKERLGLCQSVYFMYSCVRNIFNFSCLCLPFI